jgi:ATP-binding cassette subfamily B protein
LSDIRRLLSYVTPYWPRLALVLLLALLGTLVSLSVPYLFRSLVDEALIGKNAGALVRIVATFVGLTLVSYALNVVSGLRYTRVSADILFDMRLAVFRKLQELSPRFYAKMPLGQIVSRINADIGELQRVATEITLGWLGSLVYLVGSALILWYLDAWLFLVSIALLPASLWALIRYRRRLEVAIADLRNQSAEVGTVLIESLQGMKLVVAHNAQEREANRLRVRNDGFVASLMAMRRLSYLAGGLPGILLTMGSAVVLLLGGWRVVSGEITIGVLVAFVAYQMRLVAPIQGLMGLYTSIASARVSLHRVHEIIDTPVEVRERQDAQPIGNVRGDVAFEGVSFSFDRGAPVLDRLDLAVAAGERIAIVGRSGEGKSTIADLLVRHLDPDSGRVTIDGHDIRSLRLADVRRHVVVVDQNPFVFNTTLRENIRFATPGASEQEIQTAAFRAGLEPFVTRSPRGLDTEVGEGGRALSAGERQRVAIARAFLANPTVLVLDEATGSLDAKTEAEVVAGYEELMAGRTTIVITHRPELARRADRIVTLEGGSIIGDGGGTEKFGVRLRTPDDGEEMTSPLTVRSLTQNSSQSGVSLPA